MNFKPFHLLLIGIAFMTFVSTNSFAVGETSNAASVASPDAVANRTVDQTNPIQIENSSLEEVLADTLFQPVDFFQHTNFDYLAPNEGRPQSVKRNLDAVDTKGILVSTGTERSFFDLIFCKDCTGLVVRDITPKVKAYIDFAVLAFRLAKTRSEFVELTVGSKIHSFRSEHQERQIKEHVVKMKLLLQGAHLPSKTYRYYDDNLETLATVYFSVSQNWRNLPQFSEVNYLENDEQFLKLQKFALQGNIVASIGDIGDLDFLSTFKDQVKVIDTSNICDYSILDIRTSGNPAIIWTVQLFEHSIYYSYIHHPLNHQERAEYDQILDSWEKIPLMSGGITRDPLLDGFFGMQLRSRFESFVPGVCVDDRPFTDRPHIAAFNKEVLEAVREAYENTLRSLD